MTRSTMPSARAIEFVLANARWYAPPGFVPSLSTRVAELPALGYRGAWATLLLGAGFDEFSPVLPASEPQTLEDVALHFDVLAAATEAARAEDPVASPPVMPPDLLRQLHRLERERSAADRDTAIRGAAYSDADRSRPSGAGWWKSAQDDLVAVFDATGGHSAGDALARVVAAAMSEPAPGSLVARAKWPVERAHAAALAALGPAFVAFGTMASVAVADGRVVVAHVGDARVVRIRDGGCERLTVDHRWNQWPQQRIVSRAIGAPDGFTIDIRELVRTPGDVLLLATHAVFEMFDDAQLVELARADGSSAADVIVSRLASSDPTCGAAVALVLDQR